MPLPTNLTRTRWNNRKPSVVVFDVNETLLDIEALNPLRRRESTVDAGPTRE
jgi:hypothetical protein